jgi:hypothetical protein
LGGVGAYVVLSIGIVQSVVVLNSVPRWCQVLPHRFPFRAHLRVTASWDMQFRAL